MTDEWRYLAGGRVTHQVDGVTSATCGVGSAVWLGTGNQAEYDRAATLPRCRHCTRISARRDANLREAGLRWYG